MVRLHGWMIVVMAVCRIIPGKRCFCAAQYGRGTQSHAGQSYRQVVTGITASQEFDAEISDNHLQSCIVVGIALFVSGSSALLNNRPMNWLFTGIIHGAGGGIFGRTARDWWFAGTH